MLPGGKRPSSNGHSVYSLIKDTTPTIPGDCRNQRTTSEPLSPPPILPSCSFGFCSFLFLVRHQQRTYARRWRWSGRETAKPWWCQHCPTNLHAQESNCTNSMDSRICGLLHGPCAVQLHASMDSTNRDEVVCPSALGPRPVVVHRPAQRLILQEEVHLGTPSASTARRQHGKKSGLVCTSTRVVFSRRRLRLRRRGNKMHTEERGI